MLSTPQASTTTRTTKRNHFCRLRDPASTIPIKPNPGSCIHRATIPLPCCVFAELVDAVVMVRVDVVPFVPRLAEAGENLQVAFAGNPPLQLSVTALPKVPPTGLTVMVYVAVDPAFTVFDPGVEERLKSDPIPDKPNVCAAFCALSVTVMVPVRVPEAVGVNTTLIVQLAP